VTSKPDFKVMVLLLVFMQLTRDLFAIAKFLLNYRPKSSITTCIRNAIRKQQAVTVVLLMLKISLDPVMVSNEDNERLRTKSGQQSVTQ